MSTEQIASNCCGYCKSPTSAEQLTSVAGLGACEACRGGALDAAVSAWGFVEEVEQYHTRDTGSSEVNEHVLKVEVRRPGGVELTAGFSTQKPDGWFKRTFSPSQPDPEVGVEEFDDAVRIRTELDQEAQLARVFQAAGARESVLVLLSMGCKVQLVGRTVFAEIRRYEKSRLPALTDVRRMCIALSIHLA